jgi:transposase
MEIRYGPAARERAMKIQEVMLRAMSGELSWLQAADILGMNPRSLRRWRRRYEVYGYEGLYDRRRGVPSPRRAPMDQVQEVLRLYRKTYKGFNVQHFHGIARREHGVKLSYTYVRTALQEAGLVEKRRKRGKHRRRRERKECFGQMLHLDGSKHAWLALLPDQRQVMIHAPDDATGKILYAQLWDAEGTWEVMTALREVMGGHGLPMSLYTDRAGWAFHTPKAGGKVDKKRLTQVGRALAKLGVEHIPSYSPQARGRSERMNRTLQDRLVNELRVAGIRTKEEANRYLREVFIPRYNEEFGRAPANPESAFVPVSGKDLDDALCIEGTRKVAKDNTVRMANVQLQIEKQPGRASCAGLMVTVRRHLDGAFAVWWGKRLLGRWDAKGRSLVKGKASTPLRATPSAPWRPEKTEETGHFIC